jgi:hypothetical protein
VHNNWKVVSRSDAGERMHDDVGLQQRQRRCDYFNGEQVTERAVPEQSKTIYTSEND